MELTASELEDVYGHWGNHPEFPVEDWNYEAGQDDTRLGYWEWVANKLDEEELDN